MQHSPYMLQFWRLYTLPDNQIQLVGNLENAEKWLHLTLKFRICCFVGSSWVGRSQAWNQLWGPLMTLIYNVHQWMYPYDKKNNYWDPIHLCNIAFVVSINNDTDILSVMIHAGCQWVQHNQNDFSLLIDWDNKHLKVFIKSLLIASGNYTQGGSKTISYGCHAVLFFMQEDLREWKVDILWEGIMVWELHYELGSFRSSLLLYNMNKLFTHSPDLHSPSWSRK